MASRSRQDDLYNDAVGQFGPALDRLAVAYEFDPEKRRDLLQEIHFSLWRSFAMYDTRCSLRTWIYRVAHNTATTYVVRQRRVYATLVSLEELDEIPREDRSESTQDQGKASERLFLLIQRLKHSIAKSSSPIWKAWTEPRLARSSASRHEDPSHQIRSHSPVPLRRKLCGMSLP
jgi:RNA polymerase sigma factor (sigma-70 family)